jgi:KDO2-lipid IV(A) lauroyltransferase
MNKLTRDIEYFIYKGMTIGLAALPRPVCLAIGSGLGRLAYHLDRKHREIALSNLRLAFGRAKSNAEIIAVARGCFRLLGRTIVDILKLSHLAKPRILSLITTDGREHLESALASGNGVLIFTAHYGNWELASGPISEAGPFHVIARALDNSSIDRDLVRLRNKLGANVISKFGAARPVLRALARNEIVGLLIDLNVLRSQAVFVDFFGKPAATTPALAAFHLKAGAPLVPLFCRPAEKGRYCLTFLEPLAFAPSGHFEDDVLKITQTCTKIIEREIRERPECWFWVHKRWNTRPADEVTTV